jgi:hypothetical protein
LSSQAFTLSPDAWTDLGPAPQSVQLINGGPVFVTVQPSPPAANAAYHVISTEPHRSDNVTVTYTGNVYARSGGSTSATITATN